MKKYKSRYMASSSAIMLGEAKKCAKWLWHRVRQHVKTSKQTRHDHDLFRPYTKANTPVFDLNGHEGVARVVSVYDGDTCQIVLPLFSEAKMWRFSARLRGINACEMKDPSPLVKTRAIAARDRLVQLVSGDTLLLANSATPCGVEYAPEV
jgi:endonuclease YncB( thermonuclease family)